MARDPAITFRGALQILGHHDRPWLDRLDRLLGGVILASGAVPVSAVWGWIDQKNEATGLLRRGLDAVSNRLTRTGGLGRHELVVAAHTTLVLAAFFEILRDRMGGTYDEAALTEREKVMIGTGEWQALNEPLIRHLYTQNVPPPSALRGFEENVAFVATWAADRAGFMTEFLKGIGLQHAFLDESFAFAVAERYRSDYLRLATAVPEFKVWADLGEHAATRTALARLEDLLSQTVRESGPRDLRALVGEINRAELTRPVIDVDIDGYGIDAVFPTVERIFLTPHFRTTRADRSTRIGDEHWWQDFEPRQDLDLVLARHFSTPGATTRQLLLLGHPGAGKSLLTKVLAARLPESTYTVVRVPLRRVDADAHVSTQIQQALSTATHGRVSWPELADQSADTIRVILLDGLDELLQATTNDRAGYLTDVAEFQRVEAAMGRPVAVVVTSRTLVADRVRVPEGTPVLKLEDFDKDQVQEWLRIWNEVNAGARPVRPEAVAAQEHLARQPLLLLMLTLYFADPEVAPTDANLSISELYERLFDTYARREVTKQAGRVLSPAELTEAVRTQLSRLSVAALGMFNRGRQSITEAELSADLAALEEPAPAGGRLLGEFFFVHAPEATAADVQRGYEFLHATFGEYLVAVKAAETLADVAEGAYGRRRFHEPDDELLFALLSHQPLAVRRPTIAFIEDRLGQLDEAERTQVRQTLELLIRGYRRRRPATRYLDYRPQPPETVRALAAYSVNLVLLRLVLAPPSVELTTLWPDEPNVWPAMVHLWAAGLDAEGHRAVLGVMERVAGAIGIHYGFADAESNNLKAARLRGESATVQQLLLGNAVRGDWILPRYREPQEWIDDTLSVLLQLMLGYPIRASAAGAPESVPTRTTAAIADLALGVLGLRCGHLDRDMVEDFLRWHMRLRSPAPPSPLPLALIERAHPGLFMAMRMVPEDSWTTGWRWFLDEFPESLIKTDVTSVVEYLNAAAPDWQRLLTEGAKVFPRD